MAIRREDKRIRQELRPHHQETLFGQETGKQRQTRRHQRRLTGCGFLGWRRERGFTQYVYFEPLAK
jgi:hypothetical protein